MNLHRATSKADWAELKPSQRNQWQRLAFASKGIVTPGNLITIIGFTIVIVGLFTVANHSYRLGITALVIGRLCDIADGWAADLTATKSPLGELLDVSVDKITTVAIAITLVASGLVQWWILLILIVPHIVITGITLCASYHSKRIHPSRAGKLSMAMTWVSLIGLVLVHALRGTAAHSLVTVVYVMIVISVGLGLSATYGYLTEQD